MSSEREVELPILNAMHLDGLIIRAGEEQFAVVAVIKGTDGRVVGLDGEGVALCVVGPDLNRLILGGTGELVAQGGEFDVSDCILREEGRTRWPIYLKMLPEALRFQTNTILSLEPVAICLLGRAGSTIGGGRRWP
jgi:hypothetical protein